MKRHLTTLILLTALFASLGASAAGPVNTDRSGVAAKGYDVVAYFTQGRAVPGHQELSVRHEGATYRFASAENRSLFVTAPAKYLPQFGGYCAYGVAQGVKADIEPEAFTVIDGKLYLNLDAEIQRRWRRDPASYIESAKAKWPSVMNQ